MEAPVCEGVKEHVNVGVSITENVCITHAGRTRTTFAPMASAECGEEPAGCSTTNPSTGEAAARSPGGGSARSASPYPLTAAVVRRATSVGESLICTEVLVRSAIRSSSRRTALPPISCPAWSTLVREMGLKEANVVLS